MTLEEGIGAAVDGGCGRRRECRTEWKACIGRGPHGHGLRRPLARGRGRRRGRYGRGGLGLGSGLGSGSGILRSSEVSIDVVRRAALKLTFTI